MFVDASALCAMIAGEDDAEMLLSSLQASEIRATSPLAVWETVTNLPRLVGIGVEQADVVAHEFLSIMGIAILPVAPETTAISLEAYRRYGKRRHPANLNFGDCFAYACARHYRMPLLFKGNDFSLTDIENASAA
jgi:ribonuclease VapC